MEYLNIISPIVSFAALIIIIVFFRKIKNMNSVQRMILEDYINQIHRLRRKYELVAHEAQNWGVDVDEIERKYEADNPPPSEEK